MISPSPRDDLKIRDKRTGRTGPLGPLWAHSGWALWAACLIGLIGLIGVSRRTRRAPRPRSVRHSIHLMAPPRRASGREGRGVMGGVARHTAPSAARRVGGRRVGRVSAAAERAGTAAAPSTSPALADPEAPYRRVAFPGGIPVLQEPKEAQRQAMMAELAMLNARLAGEAPHTARKRVEWLKRRRRNWGLIAEHVTEPAAANTLAAVNAAARRVDDKLAEHSTSVTSVGDLVDELAVLQRELEGVHSRAHAMNARVDANLARIRSLEDQAAALDDDQVALVQEGPGLVAGDGCSIEELSGAPVEHCYNDSAAEASAEAEALRARRRRKGLRSSFADARSLQTPNSATILNHWYPVMFEAKLNATAAEPYEFTMLNEDWELLPSADGWTCVAKEAAGWGAERRVLRTGVQDGLVFVWPGEGAPEELPTQFALPGDKYVVHSELILEDLDIEWGLLVENLLDLAHAPFTHTGTFAKGWKVPNSVQFAASAMRKPGDGWGDMTNMLASGFGVHGEWNPYPIDMSFVPPCQCISHIGLAQAGAAGSGAQFVPGSRPSDCPKHLYQLHCCVPGKDGKTRLLYRMALDFAGWAKHVPGIDALWREMANQVLGEDMRLVQGQQDRMERGGRVWAFPVAYDQCALGYRRWRNGEEREVPEKAL